MKEYKKLEDIFEECELQIEISERSEEEIEEIKNALGQFGWKFNRSEPRYQSCIMAIFEKH